MKRTNVALLWLAAFAITIGSVVWQSHIAALDPERGTVPALLFLPHIATMFLGMLFSNAAVLSAAARRDQARRQGWAAITLLAFGGLVLGPAVHKYAYGTWWADGLSGPDLTGIQSAVAVVVWGVALLVARGTRWGGEPGRHSSWVAIVAAGVVTLAVFVVPRSLFGSGLEVQ
ncbi:MAG: hypothetical protein ABIV06_13500 [Thermoanaerobaculia bacterium]